MTSNADFVREALTAQGIRYVLGAKWGGGVWPPRALDCSGLVTAVAQRLGLGIGRVHGSANQWAYCARYGRRVTAVEAATTPGLLCFRVGVTPINHVAITLGDNKTMEARSSHTTPQVGVFGAMTSRRWTAFVTIPGVTYREEPVKPPPSPAPPTPTPPPAPDDGEEDDDMPVSYMRHPNGAIALTTRWSYAIFTAAEFELEAALAQMGGTPVKVNPVTAEQWTLICGPRLDVKAINAAAHR